MIAAGLDDPRERLEVGSIIHLPPAVWIRERIKYWQTFEQLDVSDGPETGRFVAGTQSL